MRTVFSILGAAVLLLCAMYACNGKSRAQHAECVEKGIAMYKEQGSYPRLRTTGEVTADIVSDRCWGSRIAFGPLTKNP